MLTPKFELDQDETHLIVKIYAPFTNIKDTEVFMEGCDFRFFSKPYFLRLHLPAEIEETDSSSAKYEPETTCFIVKATKVETGKHFENLDMISQLLQPKGESKTQNAKIEVLASSENDDAENREEFDENGDLIEEPEEEEEFDWFHEQKIHTEEEEEQGNGFKFEGYGFGFGQHGVFKRLREEYGELLDVKDVDDISLEERKRRKLSREDFDFCSDHYLADLYEDEDQILPIIDLTADYTEELSEREKERMLALPRREYLLDKKEDLQSTFFGLVDLTFAFCYENRSSQFDLGPESSWTIAKLSSTLSCCDRYESLKSVVISCSRRSLIYPLYRNYDLTKACWKDLVVVLKSRKKVLKCLLQMIPLLHSESDGKYIFNQLYVEPYAFWIQSVEESKLVSLSEALDQTLTEHLTKANLELELDELEHAAELVMKEKEEEKFDLAENFRNLTVENKNGNCEEKDSDDSSSSSSEESSSSDESSGEESEEESEEESAEESDKEETGEKDSNNL